MKFFLKNINDKFIPITEYYYISFNFYKYYRINKNVNIRSINKKIKNFKNKSFERDKNLSIFNKYYNISVYNGNKENFFTNFNKFINLFFYNFIKYNNNLSNYIIYNDIFRYINNQKNNFNFDYLIIDYLHEYYSIFDIQLTKVPKKYKLKLKKKYIFELKYVYIKKRLKNVLKIINNSVKSKNGLNLKFNLFVIFIDIVLNPKNSFLMKRKIKIYSKAMKKFFKKNLI